MTSGDHAWLVGSTYETGSSAADATRWKPSLDWRCSGWAWSLSATGRSRRSRSGCSDAINDLPGALYPILWPFQQLGAVLVGPLVALVALVLRKYRLAVATLLVTIASSSSTTSSVDSRQRPSTSIGLDIHRRGTVSVTGEAFVFGHAVLVAALATIIEPYLPGRWRLVPWIVVALVLVTRVYVGAHNPLDVICGAGLGVAVGALLNLALGVPGRPDDGEPIAGS